MTTPQFSDDLIEKWARKPNPRKPSLFHVKPGFCRWCGQVINDPNAKKRGRCWHSETRGEPPCIETYLLHHSGYLRDKVWERDQGVCASCGHVCQRYARPGWFDDDRWEADHIKPRTEGGSITLENVQTLCWDCHKKKTARENSARKRKGTR